MNALLLPIALLLPWVAGAVALRPLRERLSLTLAGWLGYGYFLGAALLTACAFLASLFTWLATTIGLLVCLTTLTLVVTVGATRTVRRLPADKPLLLHSTTRCERWLTALLLALMALHLGFAAFELYWRPVYPWDAWQTWAYTAKAWYFSGAPVDMLPPNQWLNLRDPNVDAYTVQGHHYPWLLPAQSWWSASILGSWQDNRVTWPALPAAVALGLALWGQAVAATGRHLAGPLAAALLLSLPLLHTHIALAGYADLWLAGFSGLGLIAIARGLLEEHRGQLVLGLAAAVLGLLVKHDAIIWLACGLLLIGLMRGRQLAPTKLVLTITLSLGALAYGLSRIQLQMNPDFSQYAKLLWIADSWHILWYLLPGALLLALLPQSPARITAKAFGSLLALILLSQLVLFGATHAGSWIITAASRLLLQVTPFLIFALVCLICAHFTPTPFKRWGRTALAISASSLCTLLIIFIWLTSTASPASSPEPALNFSAQQLHAVYGPVRQLPTKLQLAPATEGRAIITTGPVQFDAATFDLLDANIDGAGQDVQSLFWRTAANPSQPFIRDLVLGAGPVTLSDNENWQGEITEVGLILYPNPNHPVSLQQMTLSPLTALARLHIAIANWLTPDLWTQASINRITLSTESSLPSLTLLAGGWVLLCWLALRLINGATAPLMPFLGVALSAWLLLDARWLLNSYHQAMATQAHYAKTQTPEALDLANDDATLKLARQVNTVLDAQPHRIIATADGEQKFALRRLKYNLLPHSVYVIDGPVSPKKMAAVDAIIWLAAGKSNLPGNCQPPLRDVLPKLTTPRGILCMTKPTAHHD
ncbi:hypothetical protein QWI17_15900 [Gilvimarinus sp. SDUM040013]|uniref:Glycosyltransferase RgtA/B/C/D-like domain-containing protein n=1 Tax=Gilvimarinus gilvus TaxID=3058038 RepID=A0ABU4RVW5_9GAMM|nr:hypothetical protein [Gilvimarinus sp. SDUM040013]MDO3387325.1 hypothetical protein [Gilvimarinus sp. SDUM040013]MDX6849014.1 hypothetical protein [Gilvimarinus sp. SDUM040013]